MVSDDVGDVGAGFDLFDVTLSNSAGHDLILVSPADVEAGAYYLSFLRRLVF
jgi:hypothetical protein